MIRHIAVPAIVAALMASPAGPQGCETTDPVTTPAPAPPQKGDPGIPHEVHPDYPTAEAPDPRSNGRWMVAAIRTDEDGSHSVMCWINSDESTLRQVFITPTRYEEYMAIQDTGSIPCPG